MENISIDQQRHPNDQHLISNHQRIFLTKYDQMSSTSSSTTSSLKFKIQIAPIEYKERNDRQKKLQAIQNITFSRARR